MACLAAVFACPGLLGTGVAWLGDGDWYRGRGMDRTNRDLAAFLVVVPLVLSGLCAAIAVVLFRRSGRAVPWALLAGCLPVAVALAWGVGKALGVQGNSPGEPPAKKDIRAVPAGTKGES